MHSGREMIKLFLDGDLGTMSLHYAPSSFIVKFACLSIWYIKYS